MREAERNLLWIKAVIDILVSLVFLVSEICDFLHQKKKERCQCSDLFGSYFKIGRENLSRNKNLVAFLSDATMYWTLYIFSVWLKVLSANLHVLFSFFETPGSVPSVNTIKYEIEIKLSSWRWYNIVLIIPSLALYALATVYPGLVFKEDVDDFAGPWGLRNATPANTGAVDGTRANASN